VNKKRLDILLVEKGYFPSRQKAKTSIMAGEILVDGQRVDKASTMVSTGAKIDIKGDRLPFVSRGGLKLKKAIEVFGIDFQGKVVIDVGASTGGFTDCALQHGALKVIAIDVGYGQLAWKLRQDPRVVLLERTNIRFVTPALLGGLQADIITVDVSFISLRLVLPVLIQLLKAKGSLILLVKPQFEAGREKVGKKGVVRNPAVHREVLQEIIRASQSLNLGVKGLDYSPIKGPEGNIEYLLWLTQEDSSLFFPERVEEVVQKAHHDLG
jgi:23S rRNA (cytidine1920-2'-O)/16S rRNA (cytidine1409-2'-O)-methyltransferase